MKNISLVFAIVVLFANGAIAQNTYKTDFANNPNNRIKIDAASENITIIGHDRNEIVIEMVSKSAASENKSQMNDQQAPEDPERSKGLKPLTSSGVDNTGIGLTIEKSDNQFVVKNIMGNAVKGNYVFKIPNKVKLNITEIKPFTKSYYNISGMSGEINITSLNSAFVLKDISGPVVMANTNGNIEIAYSKLELDKPNSLTAVNGYIDITLPSDSKADFKINAVNGEAFSDFDIKAESGKEGIPFIQNFNIFNLAGKINGGGVPFTVSAVNGNVYIRKGK